MCRFQLLLYGKMPVTEDLKLSWYDTQNIHLCTVKDFLELLKVMKLNNKEIYGITRKKMIQSDQRLLNIFAAHAVLVVTKKLKASLIELLKTSNIIIYLIFFNN